MKNSKATPPQANDNAPSWEAFTENLARISTQSQELLAEFMRREPQPEGVVAASMESAVEAFQEMLVELMKNPEILWKAMFELWQEYLTLWANTTARMMGSPLAPAFEPGPKDRRFKDAAWSENVLFDFIKQSYLLTNHWVEERLASSTMHHLDKHRAKQVEFYTRQFMNALSPANFPFTNPQVIEEMLRTNGENLVKGLGNVLKDLKEDAHQFQVGTTDKSAFAVGKNLAVTPGKVIFRNRLLELIQYTPTTAKAYKTPLLVISPWINKYYILDMRPENSFVKWLTDQGHTVFITSWVNPGRELSGVRFEDYMHEGVLAALDAIKQATGEERANVIGYCIGGTLLTMTLGWLKAKKLEKRVASATFLTTLIDFSEPGDLGVFVDEEQVNALEEKINHTGYYDGRDMAHIFSMLRSNEMIWSFVVNNYLLGKERLPFDLLYWNADSTSLPAAMHLFYLKHMYIRNLLCRPNGMMVAGVPLDVTKITTPSYFLSTKEDHIAPWVSTYSATKLFRGPLRFVLSASGHVAGVVNPPGSKYGHWVNEKMTLAGKDFPSNPDDWLNTAKESSESWWLDWQRWVTGQGYAGEKIPARQPGDGKLKPLMDAPGSYVRAKIGE